MFPRTAARCLDADAALLQLVQTELGALRILSAPHWHRATSGLGDETYFGTIVLGIERSPARVELSLWYGALTQLEARFARTPRSTIEIERPSAPVLDFARRLAACWLAIASAGALVLDGTATWRPIEEPRDLPGPETWHGRSLSFDAHLSQLMSEPIGVLELCAPASVLLALEPQVER